MLETGLPFDDVKKLIDNMPALNTATGKKHDLRQKDLLFQDGLEAISGLSRHLSQCQGLHPPQLMRPEIAIFAGSHGILKNKITKKTHQDVVDLLAAIQEGNAPLNQICAQYNAGLKVFEVGFDLPTEDITLEAAMSEKETVATVAYGMEAVAQGGDLLALSSLGAGNIFVATILASYLIGGEAEDWLALEDATGEAEFKRQIEAFHKIKQFHNGDYEPLEALRRVSGREIAALAGAIIASRYQNIPVLLDSLSALTAALMLRQIRSDAIDHCLVAHVSGHQAMINIVNALQMRPVIDMDFAPDGGIGAASAIGLLRSAISIHNYSGHKAKNNKKVPA